MPRSVSPASRKATRISLMASRNIGRYGSADYRSERRAQRLGQSLLTSLAAFSQSLAGWPAVNRDLGRGGIRATHFGKMIACGFLPCASLSLIRKISPVSCLAVQHGSGGALDET